MFSASQTNLLDTAAAAAALGLSVSTLSKWRVTGNGPRFVKLGASVRYDLAALNAFKAASERQSTSARAAA